jgi:predicted ATPase
MATKGYAAPEAAQAYVRARELCQQVHEPGQLCVVLWGLRTYYNGRAAFHTARQVAEQLLAVAQRLAEPALLVVAHRALGHTRYFQGDVAAAYEHFAQGSALYDVRHHRSSVLLYENDPGVVCLCFAAVALWHPGYPDRARQRMQAALQLAQDVAHPSSQALALALAVALYHNLREVHTTREHAEVLLALVRTHGFSGWVANGMIFRGWALAQQGQVEAGRQEIRQGLTTLRTAGIELNRPRFLMALAEASAQAGQPAAGLTALTEAGALMHSTGGHLYQAELYRLYGELTLRLGAVQPEGPEDTSILTASPAPRWPVSSPEAAFQTAIAIAQRQQAKALELRAVMSLARLWQQQGKRQEARQMLAEVYGWFTEGFDTVDLQEARTLLAALAG